MLSRKDNKGTKEHLYISQIKGGSTFSDEAPSKLILFTCNNKKQITSLNEQLISILDVLQSGLLWNIKNKNNNNSNSTIPHLQASKQLPACNFL